MPEKEEKEFLMNPPKPKWERVYYPPCKWEGCTDHARIKGFCKVHYEKDRKKKRDNQFNHF